MYEVTIKLKVEEGDLYRLVPSGTLDVMVHHRELLQPSYFEGEVVEAKWVGEGDDPIKRPTSRAYREWVSGVSRG